MRIQNTKRNTGKVIFATVLGFVIGVILSYFISDVMSYFPYSPILDEVSSGIIAIAILIVELYIAHLEEESIFKASEKTRDIIFYIIIISPVIVIMILRALPILLGVFFGNIAGFFIGVARGKVRDILNYIVGAGLGILLFGIGWKLNNFWGNVIANSIFALIPAAIGFRIGMVELPRRNVGVSTQQTTPQTSLTSTSISSNITYHPTIVNKPKKAQINNLKELKKLIKYLEIRGKAEGWLENGIITELKKAVSQGEKTKIINIVKSLENAQKRKNKH